MSTGDLDGTLGASLYCGRERDLPLSATSGPLVYFTDGTLVYTSPVTMSKLLGSAGRRVARYMSETDIPEARSMFANDP